MFKELGKGGDCENLNQVVREDIRDCGVTTRVGVLGLIG